MPHIAITLYPGRDDETKKNLALAMEKTMVETLGISPDLISVSVQDIPPEQWKETMKQFPEEIIYVTPNV